MSPGIVLTVFVLVALAELPDKTMIATLVMGSRNRPLLVWLGGAGAFLIHVTVAVAAGRLIELLPHEALEIVVTALFFCGAVYLLAIPERREEEEGRKEAGEAGGTRGTTGASGVVGIDGERVAAEEDGQGGPAETGGPRLARWRAAMPAGPWRVVATAFGIILVGELGDLTQILTVNLVAKYHQPWAVFVGAYAGLLAMSAAGAFGGRALLRWLPLEWIRRAGGLALLGFAAYGIYSLAA